MENEIPLLWRFAGDGVVWVETRIKNGRMEKYESR
jgi:hypothetical protein